MEIYAPKVTFSVLWIERTVRGIRVSKGKVIWVFFIESYEVSNDTVMIRLQKDTYGRDFNLESGASVHYAADILPQDVVKYRSWKIRV